MCECLLYRAMVWCGWGAMMMSLHEFKLIVIDYNFKLYIQKFKKVKFVFVLIFKQIFFSVLNQNDIQLCLFHLQIFAILELIRIQMMMNYNNTKSSAQTAK